MRQVRCQHSSDKQFHPLRGQWNHFPKSGRSANCRGDCFAVASKTILGSGLCKVAATCTPAESQVSIDRRADCAAVPRASEKTHKQTSTFYIYRRPHFQLLMSLAQSPHTHVTSVAADKLHWQDESPPSPPRDWPVVSTGLCHAAGTPKQNMDSGPRNTRGFLNNVRQASISTRHPTNQQLVLCTQNIKRHMIKNAMCFVIRWKS